MTICGLFVVGTTMQFKWRSVVLVANATERLAGEEKMTNETTIAVYSAAMRTRDKLMQWVDRKRDVRELPESRLDIWEIGYVNGGIQAALQSLRAVCDLDDRLLCSVHYDDRGDIEDVDLTIHVRVEV